MQTIKEETDGLHEELEFIRLLGTDLIFACGETEKPEVKKSIDEVGKAAASYSHRMREELAWKSLTSLHKERFSSANWGSSCPSVSP